MIDTMLAQPYTPSMARSRLITATDSLESNFRVFSQLPTELRLMIWSLCLPGPRIISIRCDPRPVTQGALHQQEEDLSHGRQLVQCRSPTPVPATLHVCRESRSEALRRYKLLFGMGGEPGTIYFNPLSDALYFGTRDGFSASAANLSAFMAMISPSDRAVVRHIAVNEALISSGRRRDRASVTPAPQQLTERLICEVRARFRNLRRLTFVCSDRNPIYSSDSVFVDPPQRNRFIERQIKAAVDSIVSRYPSFAPPPWRVRAIAAEPNLPVYNQGILGYRGRRSSLLRPYLGARRFWSSRQCACNSCGYSRPGYRLPCTKPTPYSPLQGHVTCGQRVLADTGPNNK
ncbi:hypothetical protein F5Y10DRAFT_13401 [Nemania abortiva]|nr:hypothetical protein F5Y10DRAFT_13401 [Nemania abortiva]